MYKPSRPSKWQKYQASLQKTARRKQLLKKVPFLLAMAGLLPAILVLLVFSGLWLSEHLSLARPVPPADKAVKNPAYPEPAAREDLIDPINRLARDSAKLAEPIVLDSEGRRYFIHTTIYAKLQKFILKSLWLHRTAKTSALTSQSLIL